MSPAQPRRLSALAVALISLLKVAAAVRSLSAEGGAAVPHVDECNFCQKCIVDGPPPRPDPKVGEGLLHSQERFAQLRLMSIGAKWEARQAEAKGGSYDAGFREASARQKAELDKFVRSLSREEREGRGPKPLALPFPIDEDLKATLPNCTVCRGCNAELTELAARTFSFLGKEAAHPRGHSGRWVFTAKAAGAPAGAPQPVVKVECVPIHNSKAGEPTECNLIKVVERIQRELFFSKLAADCGAASMYPHMEVMTISAIIPGLGFHVRWPVLVMSLMPGVPIEVAEQLVGTPKVSKMLRKLNSTQVLMAATLDVLMGQCNRHERNIVIDEGSNMYLIDNGNAVYDLSNESCQAKRYNSLFLPGSSYFNSFVIDPLRWSPWRVMRTQNGTASKPWEGQPEGAPPQKCISWPVNYMPMLDYRCHVDTVNKPELGALVGTNYLPSVRKCLESISDHDTKQVAAHYSIPHDYAVRLHSIARGMLHLGMEAQLATLRAAATKMYVWQPACCKLKEVPVQREPANVAALEQPTSDTGLICDACWKPVLV